jgi:DNA-directed RNA polymerase subunit RPC12/RpoP
VYIPFRKIYRAFGELKHLSDEECEKHLRRARLRTTRWHIVPWIVGVLGAGVWTVAVGSFVVSAWGVGTAMDRGFLLNAGVFVGVPVTAALSGLMSGLLARDLVLLHLLRQEVHKARCPNCRQSLLGLPITFRGLGPPEPGDGKVRCPECGRQWILFDIGLRPTDLVPWEMRGVPHDYGKVRQPDVRAWGGRA